MATGLHRLPVGLLEAHSFTCFRSGYRVASIQRLPIRHLSSAAPLAETSSLVRLRFAPSPTGHLHLGGLRTALFNHLLARKLGGKWTLRIEDTDQTRFVSGAVESLLKTLEWGQLNFDEGPGKDGGRGPYFQSERKKVYNRHLDTLLESGEAYHCFCSSDRLASTRKKLQKSGSHMTYDRKCLGLSKDEVGDRIAAGEASVVRFKSSSDGLTQEDLVYKPIRYDSLPIEDFVLRKSDGLPTYHFANVVDDHEMGVTHVLRGEEWLPSTPKHLALYRALQLAPPQFAHLPLLINPDGSKLSKRAGDVRVEDYINRGYEPEALINFVALLGWSPQGSSNAGNTSSETEATTEVFTMEELIDRFSLQGINKNRATMSAAKLDFLNRAHLQKKVAVGNSKGRNDVGRRLKPILAGKFPGSEYLSEEYIARVVASLKERIHTIHDVSSLGAYFFIPPDLDSAPAKQLFASVPVATYRQVVSDSIEVLSALSDDAFHEECEKPLLHEALSDLSPNRKLGKEVMNPLRHALTGQKVGLLVSPAMRKGRETETACDD